MKLACSPVQQSQRPVRIAGDNPRLQAFQKRLLKLALTLQGFFGFFCFFGRFLFRGNIGERQDDGIGNRVARMKHRGGFHGEPGGFGFTGPLNAERDRVLRLGGLQGQMAWVLSARQRAAVFAQEAPIRPRRRASHQRVRRGPQQMLRAGITQQNMVVPVLNQIAFLHGIDGAQKQITAVLQADQRQTHLLFRRSQSGQQQAGRRQRTQQAAEAQAHQ